MMPTILQDMRPALRQLLRAPGFTVTALLTLALGIGATTAIFTLVYDVMLRPLPFPQPDRLVVIQERVAELREIYPELPVTANHFFNWQQNSRSFESMTAIEQQSEPLGIGGHPLQVKVLRTTPGFFPVLGVTPLLGRAFTEQEAQPGRDSVVVLMYDLWRTEFQSDRGILGKTITLNGYPYTVIGVMPQSFHPPVVEDLANATDRAQPVGALLPKAFTQDQLAEAMGDFNYFSIARLRPGVTAAQANQELDSLQHAITVSLPPNERATLSVLITPFQQMLVGNSRTPLLILLAAVAGLLLVGCVNIANLLLSRAVSRRQQMAIAAALGATGSQMMRMAMRETVVLAAMGGGLGLLLAATLVPFMQRYLPPALDFRGPLHLDWAGAGCAVLLSFAATLLAGAAPAWIVSQARPQEALRSDSRLASESRSTKRLRRVLVGVEVAVSVTLVLLTGLLTASLMRLMSTERGFEADRVLTAAVNLPYQSYSDRTARTAFYQRSLERLRQLPGVEAAGLVSVPPLGGDFWIDMIRVAGDARPFMELPTEHFRWISPGYFQAIHLPLVAGRFLEESDQGKNYVVISEQTAHTIWPGLNPIGRPFWRVDGDDTSKEPPLTVIGVVADARTINLARPDPMMVYVPYWYRCDSPSYVVVRTHQDASAMADSVRKAVWSVDPAVSVPTVRTLGSVVEDSVANRRFEMDLLLLFAVCALLLAGLGVYGVVTYSVVQRQHELGLRMALGAQRANIYTLVLRDGLLPVLAGAAAGVGIAAGSARIVSSLLYEVDPYNPAIAVGAVCLLMAVGTAACLLPARRAAAIDPMQALRME